MYNLSNKTIKRLNNFPVLKSVVEDFISCNGCNSSDASRLTDLVVYIRCLDISVPEFFGWNDYYTEQFYSWGHNSRYYNVLEPLLSYHLNQYLRLILDYLESSGISEPNLED